MSNEQRIKRQKIDAETNSREYNLNDEEILNKYSPFVKFNTEEKFFPVTAEWYIRRAKLLSKGKLVSEHNEPDTLPIDTTPKFGMQYRLPSEKSMWEGEKNNLENVPCYGNKRNLPINMIHPVLRKAYPNIIELKYIFVFAYNGSAFIVKGTPVGTHEGDLEHITVRVDGNSNKVLEVCYAAHGAHEGKFIPSEEFFNSAKEIFQNHYRMLDEVQQIQHNDKFLFYKGRQFLKVLNEYHPRVYAAKFSHASYPWAMNWKRLWGMGDDVTNDGKEWRPNVIDIGTSEEETPNYPRWVFFRGLWGTIPFIRQKPYFAIVGEDIRQTELSPEFRSTLEEGCMQYERQKALDRVNKFDLGKPFQGIQRFEFMERKTNQLFGLNKKSNLKNQRNVKIPDNWVWYDEWKILQDRQCDDKGYFTPEDPIAAKIASYNIDTHKKRLWIRTAVSKNLLNVLQQKNKTIDDVWDILENNLYITDQEILNLL